MGLEEQELKRLQDLEEKYKRCAAVNNYLLTINFALGKLLIAKGVVTKEMETAILEVHKKLSRGYQDNS